MSALQRHLVNRHRIWQAAIDAGLIALAWFAAFQLRFEDVPVYYEGYLEARVFVVVIAVKLAVFALFGFYNHWWRYVSIRDMWAVARGVLVASLVAAVVIMLWDPYVVRLPRGIFLIDGVVLLGLIAGVRLLARTVIERPGRFGIVAHGKEALVVGAGDAGQMIIREMQRNPKLGYTPIALVDDDSRKRNLRVHGVRVVGTTKELPVLLRQRQPDEVIIAIPSAAGETRQRIVNYCRAADTPVKTLPAVHELLTGDLNLSAQLREVQVEDVLGRESVDLDLAAIANYLRGEVVLVTGAGGSIGSELCRQIAEVRPRQIILVDHSENALVEIERDLALEREFRAVVPLLADTKNPRRMRELFERHGPGVAFHAAAYKHVPIMEENAIEAVRNNVLATKVMADLSSEFGVNRFVLVSTDKAVNPKNVLGQTKAICEWIVEAAAAREQNGTRFISVRFGNVLASSGSVIPLFRQQIARGGPVTVTHPDMTRYFMTIPEAAQLIVQAGAIGESGEIYVLDMGTPIRILELAHNMIRLSGKEPDRDIEVQFIGIRPGEKLHEELWGDGERAVATSHQKILRCACRPVEPNWLEDEIAELERLANDGEPVELVARLNTIIADPHRVDIATPSALPAE